MGSFDRRGLGALFIVCVAACGGGSSGVTPGADASAGDGGFTASGLIGPAGGVVTLGAASISIPAGALPAATRITITQELGYPPTQYTAYSPLYQFAPSGLTFATPATVVMPRNGGPSSLAMYWSTAGGTGYDRLASTVAAHSASAKVTHFSGGFLGIPSGVDAGGGRDSGVDASGSGHDSGSDVTTSGRDGGVDATSPGHDGSSDATSSDVGQTVGDRDANAATDASAHDANTATDASAHDAHADSGSAADAGSAGCVIGGTFYASGALQPGDSCESCQPKVRTSAFSLLPDGTSCGVGETCSNGTCTPCSPLCLAGVECGPGAVPNCASGVCTGGVCAPPACSPNCGNSSPCSAPSDCVSGNCGQGRCVHPLCSPSCTEGAACDLDTECASGVCTNAKCAPPACAPTCALGAACGESSDCASGACTNGTCATCTPQVHGCDALWEAQHEDPSLYYTDYSTCDIYPGSTLNGPYCIAAPGGGGGYCCCNAMFNPGACP